jgi:hypothetical protein
LLIWKPALSHEEFSTQPGNCDGPPHKFFAGPFHPSVAETSNSAEKQAVYRGFSVEHLDIVLRECKTVLKSIALKVLRIMPITFFYSELENRRAHR